MYMLPILYTVYTLYFLCTHGGVHRNYLQFCWILIRFLRCQNSYASVPKGWTRSKHPDQEYFSGAFSILYYIVCTYTKCPEVAELSPKTKVNRQTCRNISKYGKMDNILDHTVCIILPVY